MKHSKSLYLALCLVVTTVVLVLISPFASADGCCELVCSQTTQEQCPGKFHDQISCGAIDACNVGCCRDTEGYCLENYLKGNCERKRGSFSAERSCKETVTCLIEPQLPRGSTGFPVLYHPSQQGIFQVFPESAPKGSAFTIQLTAFREAPRFIARVFGSGFAENVVLYDDGFHGDGNPDDGTYAGVWYSGNVIIPEMTRVNVEAQQGTPLPGYFVLSPNACTVWKKPWENPLLRKDIVFVSDDLTRVRGSVDDFISRLKLVFGGSLDSLNYYILMEPVRNPTFEKITQFAHAQCTFMDDAQDLIIFLSSAEQCIQQGNIVTLPFDPLVSATFAGSVTASEFFENVCGYVKSQKEIEQEVLDSFAPPQITLVTANPSQNSSFALEFTVNDTVDFVGYKIFADTRHPFGLLAEGSIRTGYNRINITLWDGNHQVWVEAVDNAGNRGTSSLYNVNINSSGFEVVFNPENFSLMVTHREQQQIAVDVYINDTVASHLNMTPFEVVRIPFLQRPATIAVEARDNNSSFARLLPLQLP